VCVCVCVCAAPSTRLFFSLTNPYQNLYCLLLPLRWVLYLLYLLVMGGSVAFALLYVEAPEKGAAAVGCVLNVSAALLAVVLSWDFETQLPSLNSVLLDGSWKKGKNFVDKETTHLRQNLAFLEQTRVISEYTLLKYFALHGAGLSFDTDKTIQVTEEKAEDAHSSQLQRARSKLVEGMVQCEVNQAHKFRQWWADYHGKSCKSCLTYLTVESWYASRLARKNPHIFPDGHKIRKAHFAWNVAAFILTGAGVLLVQNGLVT